MVPVPPGIRHYATFPAGRIMCSVSHRNTSSSAVAAGLGPRIRHALHPALCDYQAVAPPWPARALVVLLLLPRAKLLEHVRDFVPSSRAGDGIIRVESSGEAVEKTAKFFGGGLSGEKIPVVRV